MKTKTLLILSICLLLFACGDKKQPEKIIKQKLITKHPEKPKPKEKILEVLPTKKDEHVLEPGCGHDYSVANSKHVSMMATAQEERIKLAEMLPKEIREEIAKMVAQRDINGLSTMSIRLFNMGDYDNAILIASNFLAHAETETEKQMATSFYAYLSADIFMKNNNLLDKNNKDKYDNIKSLLKNSLENTPDNIDMNHASIVRNSLSDYIRFSIKYEYNANDAFDIYNKSFHKINTLPKDFQELAFHGIFSGIINSLQRQKNYEKLIIDDNNFNRLVKYKDKIINRTGPSFTKRKSEKALQRYQNIIKNYEKYRQKK